MCVNPKQVKTSLQFVINDGGEGLIMRLPKSQYEHGRTSSLMKLKASRGDKEGIVVSVDEKKAVTLKMPDGVTFSVPVQNVKTGLNPKAGDIVTFSYEDYSRKSIPVSPKIYQIRTDVSWKDVVKSFMEEDTFVQKEEKKFTAHSYGYWAADKGRNLKNFFESYVKSKNMDPLLPSTWYSLSWDDLRHKKGWHAMMRHSKGGIITTITSLFPDIGLDPAKFDVIRNNWESVKERRVWFDQLAKQKQFDPLISKNWYNVKIEEIETIKGGSTILNYYTGSLVKALVHAYPEIGFNENKFPVVSKYYWKEKANRRKLMADYAVAKKFDPLVPTNWYSVTFRDLVKWKGMSRMLSYYNSHIKALVDLFPEIGLEESSFDSNYWKSIKVRRKWFEQYAKDRNFDPLQAHNWYGEVNQIKKAQGVEAVLRAYEGSVSRALVSLFPDIDLDSHEFPAENQWEDAARRKRYLEKFAQNRNFDPYDPIPWYSISQKDILEVKHGNSFLKHFSNNLAAALSEAFPDIAFDMSLLKGSVESKRRKFFISFAEKHNFDPLIPENWYSVTNRQIVVEGGSRVLLTFNKSLPKALLNSFPNIGLVEQKFIVQ